MTTIQSGGAIDRANADRLAVSAGAMLALSDICTILNIGRSTGEKLLANGTLPPPDLRIGKRLLRWRPSTIERFIASGGRGAR